LNTKITDDQMIVMGCVLLAPALNGGVPTVGECAALAATCHESFASGQATIRCNLDRASLAACPATIDEIKTCAYASMDQIAKTVPLVTCDMFALTPTELEARLSIVQTLPAVCDPIQQKCPGLVVPPGT
jgi:hypothetical protein